MMGTAMRERDPVALMHEAQRMNTEAELEEILAKWHQWQQGYRLVKAFNDRALVVGEYEASRDSKRKHLDLERADEELDDYRMRQVDFEVSEMEHPHKAAIYELARCLTTGVYVWISPRLPSDKEVREVIVRNARRILTARLQSAGVM
jgi:hypothetical protein